VVPAATAPKARSFLRLIVIFTGVYLFSKLNLKIVGIVSAGKANTSLIKKWKLFSF
jgi:hypothetical protein